MSEQILQNRVREGRKTAEMTLDDLAREAGVARSTLKDIEVRGHAPTPAVQAKLAAALGVRVEDLFFWSEPMAPEDEREPVEVAS